MVRDVVPTSDRWNGYREKVVLRKPEGLAEVREGTVGLALCILWMRTEREKE